jgi:hypothetical protein
VRKWKVILFLLVWQVMSFKGYAVESKGGSWVGTFTNTSISKVFSLWAESQLRFTFNTNGVSQLLYRFGLEQQNLSENHKLAYLYAFIRTSPFKEHRFALQHIMKYGKFIGLSFSHRVRLEGRFLEGDFENSARFRYFLRGDQAFGKGKFGFVFWNEFFLNLTREKWTGDKTFDQNRLFLGIKNKVFDNNRFELGYLNQYIPRKSINVMQHLVVLYYFFKS